MGSTKTPKRKKSDIKPAAETLTPLEEEAPDFRRGASVLSRSKRDEARAEADARFEAEQGGSKRRKKTKRSNAFADEADTLSKGGISGKLSKIVKSRRFEVLSKENDEGDTKDLAIGNFNSLGLAREVESRASVPPLEVNFDTEANVSRGGIVDKRKHLDNEPSEIGSKDDEKLTKRAKKKLKEKRELEIRAAEQKRLEGGHAPDTVDEYEQLVRASPNSSFVWIKYMAFLLSIADVEKARAIAERALQTINFREEEEKLNVWVAFFNLENVYGIPPNEAVLKVFQRALQYCDPKKVHLALLGMYERTGQQEMADQLLKAMTKKFKTSAKVWLRNMQNLLKQRSDAAELVLNRAIVSLPRHKHIKFISRAAVLEFKIGSAERARLLFEGVLRNYPKRTDLWSVYLDQEICRGDVSVIRSLFERVICLDLPPKKMKFLFKKYLDYEKSQGEESRIEYVKKKAMEFVNSKLG